MSEQLESFLEKVAQLFNDDPELWGCDYCRWAKKRDERICDICEVLSDAVDDAQGGE